jgi:hypothetical protein
LTKRSPSSKRTVEVRRRSKRTPEQDEVFFRLVSQGWSQTRAAEKAGYTVEGVRNWRLREEDFRKRYEEAYECGTNAFEDEVRRRGYAGVNRPVFHKGEVVGHIREYSDSLLMFLLKARKPEVYRENFSIEGKVQHDVAVTHEVILRTANERAMRAVAEIRKLAAPKPSETVIG